MSASRPNASAPDGSEPSSAKAGRAVSPYVGARFFHRTTMVPRTETFILTHQQDTTDNLLAMARSLVTRSRCTSFCNATITPRDRSTIPLATASVNAYSARIGNNLKRDSILFNTNPHKERLVGGFAGPHIRDRFLNRESDSGGREMAAPVTVTREEHTA
jgi:hypothetical protein